MQLRNSPRRYGAAVQIVHWFSVLLVGVAWVLGTVGEDLPRGRARDLGELIHVSAGELIAILLIFRVLASNQRAAASRTDAAGEIGRFGRQNRPLRALRAACGSCRRRRRDAICGWRRAFRAWHFRYRIAIDEEQNICT